MAIATIIDIGTNTFEYLVVEFADSEYRFISEGKIHVRLGEGGIEKGFITEAALNRAAQAMEEIDELSKKHGSEVLLAKATSATRDAENASQLKKLVTDKGFKISVIDGVEEARLIAKGASLSVPKTIKNYLLMDIGGGSTEFILVQNSNAVWAQSFNAGVTRLMEKFAVSDPLVEKDLERMKTFLQDELSPLSERLTGLQNLTLVGSAGSYDSIVSILTSAGRVLHSDGFQEIPMAEFQRLYQQLIRSSKNERSSILGLVKYRVPTIHLAAYQIQHVLSSLEIQRLARSPFALKEGVLFELMENFKA